MVGKRRLLIADALNAAAAEEVRRLDAEEAATATRAERAGEAAAAPAQVPSSAPGAPPAVDGADALRAVVDALGPKQIATLFIVVVDVFARKKLGEQFALTAPEANAIATAAVPVIELYLPNLKMHPVTALALTAGAIYGAKALPEGGLAALLGGVVGGESSGNDDAPPPDAPKEGAA